MQCEAPRQKGVGGESAGELSCPRYVVRLIPVDQHIEVPSRSACISMMNVYKVNKKPGSHTGASRSSFPSSVVCSRWASGARMGRNDSQPTAPIQQCVTTKMLRGKIDLQLRNLDSLDLRRRVPLDTIFNAVAIAQRIERFPLPVTGKGDIGG